MKKRITAFGSSKGGVGKTTTAINFAYLRAKEIGSENVVLVDADSKTSTATIWTGLRSNNLDLEPMLVIKKTGDKDFVQSIKMLSEKFNDVIIDIGGDNEAELVASMVVADKLFIPVRPSFVDTFNLYAIDSKISQAQQSLNPRLKAYLLPSIVSPNRLMANDDLEEIISLSNELENLSVTKNYVMDRKVYRRSPKFDGKTIFELSGEGKEKTDKAAEQEQINLYKEIYHD